MDRVSKEKRSEIMRSVRSRDTAPELALRKLLFLDGYRYRINYRKLPGKPDLAFPVRKKVIFVHGCFWHGHKNCKYGKLPKSRKIFWFEKVRANKARDKRNRLAIARNGWKSLVIWQCELKKPEKVLTKARRFLEH